MNAGHSRQHLGDLTLDRRKTPAYARPGTSNPPRSVHRVRSPVGGLACAVPDTRALDGEFWCDGGIVDIFPEHPLLDIESPVDAVVAVNAFYLPGFA